MKDETRKLVEVLKGGITKDGSEHIPGERCVEGLVKGVAKGVAPVTNPKKEIAEEAVKAAGRASAIADAQTSCDKGSCGEKGAKCTFVKMIEASSVNSTPARDPQGVIQWTARLVTFEVIGPCVCEKPKKDEQPESQMREGTLEYAEGSIRSDTVVFEVSARVETTLQTPCAGGRLQVRHAYSKCIDGTWHVVEDDYYVCPPDMRSQSFRVMDIDTGEACTKPPPNPVGSTFKRLDTECQAPNKIGEIVFTECISGCWEHATYDLYQCLDGTKRIAMPATKIQRTNDPCSSDPRRPEP
jgi:hypothetical protein